MRHPCIDALGYTQLETRPFPLSFSGNLLVIVVVCLNRRMRTTTNFFLVNLATADFSVGLFCVYQNISLYLMERWIFGDFLCRMYHFVHGMSYTASILILTVISVERYLAICHPMWSKRVSIVPKLVRSDSFYALKFSSSELHRSAECLCANTLARSESVLKFAELRKHLDLRNT